MNKEYILIEQVDHTDRPLRHYEPIVTTLRETWKQTPLMGRS